MSKERVGGMKLEAILDLGFQHREPSAGSRLVKYYGEGPETISGSVTYTVSAIRQLLNLATVVWNQSKHVEPWTQQQGNCRKFNYR